MRRGGWAALLAPLLLGCAAPQQERPQTGATGAIVEKAPAGEAAPKVPRWDSAIGVKDLWSQVATLAETGLLCPFVVHREDASAPYLKVRYDAEEVHSPGRSLHLQFTPEPGAVAGFGVGCLRRYDINIYTYAVFFVKGTQGARFYFRLKDGAETEGSYEVTVKEAGWQRVVIPLREFSAVNLKTIISVAFGFTAAQGESDLYIDDLSFTTTLPTL